MKKIRFLYYCCFIIIMWCLIAPGIRIVPINKNVELTQHEDYIPPSDLPISDLPFSDINEETKEDSNKTKNTTSIVYSQSDIYWLSMNIYHEARSEGFLGQLMVGLVTLARLHSGLYGDTIKDVVTYPHQFSWYSDGKSDIPTDKKAFKYAKRVAEFAILSYDIYKDSKIMYYHTKSVHPSWAKNMIPVCTIGNHIFYKES